MTRKTTTRKTTKRKTPRRRPRNGHGGYRIGAGRPSLFGGEKVALMTMVTTEVKAAIRAQAAELRLIAGPLGTDGAAVEYLVRLARGLPLTGAAFPLPAKPARP